MSKRSAIKHVFFDLDDTLWDFEKNSSNVLRQLFEEASLKDKLKTEFHTFLEAYKRENQLLWKLYSEKKIDKTYLRNNRFNNTFKLFNYDDYQLNLEITEAYLRRSPHGKELKEGCLDVLAYLQLNYQLHIITNGFKEVQAIKINGSGLIKYFNHIVISEDLGWSKPDKEIFLHAEKLANTKSENCVMIGDNLDTDIKGANNAGWQAIYLSHNDGINSSVTRINKLMDLKSLL